MSVNARGEYNDFKRDTRFGILIKTEQERRDSLKNEQ